MTKKSTRNKQKKQTFDLNKFNKIIDTQGNITKSFKDTNEFKSLNPHLSKDVDKMKRRIYSMYQKEKKIMNNFLVQN